MNIRFRPSLQMQEEVNIVLKFLYNIEFQIVLTDFQGLLEGFEKFYVKNVHETTRSLPLLFLTRRRLKGIIRAMVTEVTQWFDCHRQFLADANLNYWSIMRWHSYGTIDYFATAQALLQDDNLNLRQRFVLSCKYYFEDNVQTLWEDMSTVDLKDMERYTGLYNSLIVWMDALRKGSTLDWSVISDKIETDPCFLTDYPSNFFFGNYLGLIYCFRKLKSSEARFRCLSLAIRNCCIRPCDLYLCLNQMEDYEVDCMFNRFSEEQRYEVIKSFLFWPLQCIFQNVIDRFRKSMSDSIYYELVKFILFEKLEEICDHDYACVLNNLWNPLSEDTKALIRSRLYPCVEHLLKHNSEESIATDLSYAVNRIYCIRQP